MDCISDGPGHAGERTGWAGLEQRPHADAARRALRGSHRFRVDARTARENDERLAAKAATKLADLASHSRLTDPEVLAAKRAVIEAAMARARQKRSDS